MLLYLWSELQDKSLTSFGITTKRRIFSTRVSPTDKMSSWKSRLSLPQIRALPRYLTWQVTSTASLSWRWLLKTTLFCIETWCWSQCSLSRCNWAFCICSMLIQFRHLCQFKAIFTWTLPKFFALSFSTTWWMKRLECLLAWWGTLSLTATSS